MNASNLSADTKMPPPLEMQCLNILWQLGSASVPEVRGLIPRDPPLAYTTVLTLLDRLVRRGAATREKSGRGYRYTPTVDRAKVRLTALQTLADQHFDSSLLELRNYLDQITPAPPPKAFAAAAGHTAS